MSNRQEGSGYSPYGYRDRPVPMRNFPESSDSTSTTALAPIPAKHTRPPSPLETASTFTRQRSLTLHTDRSPNHTNATSKSQPVSPNPSKSSSPINSSTPCHPIQWTSSQTLCRAASPLSQQRFPEEQEAFPPGGGQHSQQVHGPTRGRVKPAKTGPDPSYVEHQEESPTRPCAGLGRMRGMTTSANTSPLHPQGLLRTSTSIPDYGPIRSGLRTNLGAMYNPDRGRGRQDNSQASSRREPLPRRDGDELRSSMRSGFTATSSSFLEASGTERSSVVTKSSSNSELRDSYPPFPDAESEGMSVEDAIMMYEQGFEEDTTVPSFGTPDEGYASQTALPPVPYVDKQAATPKLEPPPNYDPPQLNVDVETEYLKTLFPPRTVVTRDSAQIISGRASTSTNNPRVSPAVPRDRYGFKKATQNISVEAYDAWNDQYIAHLERRRKKWEQLMKSHGLRTEKPDKFPPRSDKVKRFVRKGIPPDWRGAAWFWYGGGPEWLAKNRDLYWSLVEDVKQGKLSDWDKEQIERDLNRTFPDNTRFKPESAAPNINVSQAQQGSPTPHSPSPSQAETPILKALRRVLQAFAIHNPGIGYCQSLNFLAGLLLLFLDEDEERAFVMLNIITTVHLPGTHSKILEANIDIGVLMGCIKESMPGVWAKINDMDDPSANSASIAPASARLPTVSLATTSWFMSLFVGNLPIESVLRVWDSFFYEGSKTLFRIALAIFKLGEQDIRSINDQMEIFQVVQTIPRRLIDANELMEACYKRRNGFGHMSQNQIEELRAQRRRMHAEDMARINSGGVSAGSVVGEKQRGSLRRAASRARIKRSLSRKRRVD